MSDLSVSRARSYEANPADRRDTQGLRPAARDGKRARHPALRTAVVAFALAILLPGAFFAWTAWHERIVAIEAAGDTAQRTVVALREQAYHVVKTQETLIGMIDEQLGSRDWASIADDAALAAQLRHLPGRMDGLVGVLLVDAQGVVRLSSSGGAAANVDVASRDYFRAHRAGERGLYLGAPIVGSQSQRRMFTVSRARVRGDGSFDGVIVIGVALEYFSDLWEHFAPSIAHVIPLVRDDGAVLSRYPALANPERLNPNGPFLSAIRRTPQGGLYTAVSQVDGVERINAFSRVGSYPVYIAFSIETRAVLAAWRTTLLNYGAFAVMAAAALAAMSLVLVRGIVRDKAATARWQANAERLQSEMERRAAAEEQLRQAQKMEVVGQVTGSIAHDFNNLLQVVLTNLILAERTAEGDRAARFIRTAAGAVERATRLTRQLLAFSRRQPLSPRPLDVGIVVDGMQGLLKTSLGHRVDVVVRRAPGLPLALADQNEAEMAILNLAVNARDAMPAGGTLTITLAPVDVPAPLAVRGETIAAGKYVGITVADTGEGMSADVLRHAFDPFFTTKGVGKGSGLGLSQVYGFALQSGGAAEIESGAGRGTAVRILLPAAPVTSAGASDQAGRA